MKFAYYIFFAILNLIGTIIWGYFYTINAASIYVALPFAILASIIKENQA